ncbi:hypothetical protein SAMN05192574_10796 [Mucilaginibacter gossypiicola]|uniref:Uncharacterized protein n=1 Tax=Mucilaginibacter gossypiicola TaxID=551995 RepID=A0A1H8NTZ5_9SPHI|nr:hypothetical protein [Mucilaginibacter gossypiicola]SEO33120.1 hypothetical protein SAMN05192574_10796 [Mucilaginibacter gossypiicola]
MLKIISYTLSAALLLGSCRQKKNAELAPEYLYEVKDQKPICSLIDNKKGNILMLYGNNVALQAANDSLVKQVPGAHYTLVTWKQKQMPGWYGTNMNGGIYSVETLQVSQVGTQPFRADYGFKPGEVYSSLNTKFDRDQRIRFIIEQRAAILP